MPEHPARHHAPADQLGVPTDPELERLIARDPDSLPDLHRLLAAGMLVREREHHRLAPVAPRDPSWPSRP
jgi:hypothetical protein